MEQNTKMTQIGKVVQHLERYGHITSLEAYNLYGIMRLSARINDIRRKYGYKLRAELVCGKNGDGSRVRYSMYTMPKDDEEE